jgi:formamidopyrimidine-DNA glycosylase
MPELPEVEHATRLARRITVGRTITSIALRHASQRRGLPATQARSLAGERVVAVERRGKAQWFLLASGRQLRVHFRMTGDWLIPGSGPLPRTVRAVLTFDDGSRLALDDPRALSVISLCADPDSQADGLGPDALDPGLTPHVLAESLVRRRIPIKVALLDQTVVAGVGNIYASEALWRARIDPRTPANEIPVANLRKLLRAVVATLNAALQRQQRYYGSGDGDPNRFDVYDREGEPCRRCRSRIKRITQAGRSTYFCSRCQK